MATNLFSSEGFSMAGTTPATGQVFGQSVADAVSSAGTNQATGTVLTSQQTVLSTVGSSSAVTLDPSLMVVGAVLTIRNNDAANAVLVFPPIGAGAKFDGGATDASVSLAHAVTGRYLVTSATQLRSI